MAIIAKQFTFIRQSWRVFAPVALMAGGFIEMRKMLTKALEQLGKFVFLHRLLSQCLELVVFFSRMASVNHRNTVLSSQCCQDKSLKPPP